jgi:hypothetical protein
MDTITNLNIINRKLTDQALQLLIKNEDCKPVTLDTVRPDLIFRRAVAVVLSSRGKNERNDGGALYYVTDMQGHVAKLYMSALARSGFGSKSDEGALVILINPVITSESDRGYTLIFTVDKQQDIVLVGNCSTFGRCSGIRRDGKPCSMPVNTSETTRCPHHPEGHVSSSSSSSFVFISQEEHNESKAQQRAPSSARSLPPPPPPPVPHDAFERAMQSAPVRGVSLTSAHPGRPPSSAGYTSTTDIDTEDDTTDSVKQAATAPQRDVRVNGTVRVPQQSSVFSSATRANSLQQRPMSAYPPAPPHASSSGTQRGQVTTNSLLAKPSTSSFRPLTGPAVDRWGPSPRPLRPAPPAHSATRVPGDELQVLGCGGAHAVLLNVTNLCRNGAAAAAAASSVPAMRPLDIVFGSSGKGKGVSGSGSGSSSNSSGLKRKAHPTHGAGAGAAALSKKVPGAGGVSSAHLEALLSRESSHAEEASNEWFDGFQKRLVQLERQEEKALKEEAITSISIRGSQCLTCGVLTEYPLELCRRQGHRVQTVAAVKRFYECERCGRRDSTVGSKHLPQHRCPKCNEYKWAVCGKNKTGYIVGSRDRDSDHRLITSLSADTSRADMSQVAGLTSALDYTAR